MKITDEIYLAKDVLIIPFVELSQTDRERSDCGPNEYVVSKPRSRSTSRVINQDVAVLLQKFFEPSTIVAAVIKLSIEKDASPQELLSSAFDALLPFIQAEWLVASDNDDHSSNVPSIYPDTIFEGYQILDCRHFVEDTELYQAKDTNGNTVAIKFSRVGAKSEVTKQFELEVDVLRHATGLPTPNLLLSGRKNDQSFIIMSWLEGVSADKAAHELRQLETSEAMLALFELSVQILRAYCGLHERGILHGDVYPGNILVNREGSVSLLDFGLSKLQHESTYRVRRKGVAEYYEPEFARAIG